MSRRSLLLVFCLALAAPHLLSAQDLPFGLDVPLDGVTAYDDAIPTPEEVMGHQVGTKHTLPLEVGLYFQEVARASDRVVLGDHGRTYEGRPLVHAIITSPANHARLDEIKAAHHRLSDDAASVSDAALEDMPIVLYLGYSIHGNEATGTEASLLALYHFAAGMGPAVEDVLDNAVLVMVPMFNPDGRARFAGWANRNRGGVAVTDPQNREHNEAWPGGRTNHYWFDLNRDWLPLVHPESRGRVGLFHEWRPQVLTDHHEMGSDATFFFMPGIQSRINPYTPDLNQEMTAALGEYHAQYLDDIGALYYTEESFDDFYIGKGSTYPDVQGTVGILFEQASSRALERETDNGILTYAYGVRNQFVTTLSTVAGAMALKTQLLRMHRDHYASASDFAAGQTNKAYVISLEPYRTRAQMLAELLQAHRVRVHALAERVEVDGRTYEPNEAYVVPVDQPQARLIAGVMETMTTFEDSLFYDVSTWTLPLAYAVPYGRLQGRVGRYVGPEIATPILPDGGALIGGTAGYAYLMEWGRYYAPRALHKLQDAGILPRVMTSAFSATAGGTIQEFAPGTIVIPVQASGVDPDVVHETVRRIVEEDHVTVYATSTGLTPVGSDLGSRGSVPLERPSVALIAGDGTSVYNTGAAWHLLSERFQMPVTLLEADDVARADLDRYTTIVVAGGSLNNLPVATLQNWVRAGGHLITLDSGSEWAIEEGFADLERKTVVFDSLFVDLPYDQLSTAYGAQGIGGAIFQVDLDTTHPVAYAALDPMPVFRQGTDLFEPADRPGANVGVYTESPLLSGYISDEMLGEVQESAAIVAANMGRGNVTMFMDNPNFRGFWYGTNGLFLNAIFFGAAY